MLDQSSTGGTTETVRGVARPASARAGSKSALPNAITQIGVVALAVGASILAACAPPFDFEPWSFPVPVGTTLHGYPPVSPAERRSEEPVELVEEIVIGDRDGDFDYLFGNQPPRIALANDGRIAVLDGGNHRVQVYDADGDFLVTMGRQGQGPGEFGQPIALIARDDALVVWDVVSRQAMRWSSPSGGPTRSPGRSANTPSPTSRSTATATSTSFPTPPRALRPMRPATSTSTRGADSASTAARSGRVCSRPRTRCTTAPCSRSPGRCQRVIESGESPRTPPVATVRWSAIGLWSLSDEWLAQALPT